MLYHPVVCDERILGIQFKMRDCHEGYNGEASEALPTEISHKSFKSQ